MTSRMEHNMTVMLETLRQNEIKEVVVNFSGSNDSGGVDIGNVTPLDGDPTHSTLLLDDIKVPAANMPPRMLFLPGPDHKMAARDWKAVPPTLHELILEVCEQELEAAHAGWEIDAGSCGSIHIEPLAEFHDEKPFLINIVENDDYDYEDEEYNDE